MIVHKIISKAALALAAGVGSVSLALAFAAAAGASPVTTHANGVSSFARYTQAGPDATSGYFTSPLNGNGVFTHIEGYLGSGGTTSLENLGTNTDDGQGVGLCNQGSGNAIRAGITDVSATNGTKEVTIAYGNLGPALWFGDPCANGAPQSPGSLTTEPLATVPVGDTIAVQLLAHSGFGASGCGKFQTALLWQDVSANPGVWHSGCVSTGFKPVYNEGDAGVIGDTQGMEPPAVNRLADFAHLGLTELTGHHQTVHGSFQSDDAWTAFPVFASTNGASSGSILLAPSAFKNDGMGVRSGTPVS
jgi:hypothetical protein